VLCCVICACTCVCVYARMPAGELSVHVLVHVHAPQRQYAVQVPWNPVVPYKQQRRLRAHTPNPGPTSLRKAPAMDALVVCAPTLATLCAYCHMLLGGAVQGSTGATHTCIPTNCVLPRVPQAALSRDPQAHRRHPEHRPDLAASHRWASWDSGMV